MNMTCDQCGAENPADIHTCTPKPAPVQDTVAFKQFLSDVHTAAGLVTHGKQCKALGERLGEGVMRYTATPPAAQVQEQGADKNKAHAPITLSTRWQDAKGRAWRVLENRHFGRYLCVLADNPAYSGEWTTQEIRAAINKGEQA
jgi:hypothetical protein